MMKQTMIRILLKLLFLLCLFYLLFGIMFGLLPMPNEDMKPGIRAGDVLFYQRRATLFHQNDVIVYTAGDHLHVGRIIAQSGDIIEITDSDALMINHSVMLEQDIYYPTPMFDSNISYPMEIGNEAYFILGDYRENAKDSRIYGAIPKANIKGKVITVLRRNLF